MIKAIIVDDERPALDKLEKLLKDSGLVTVEGAFTEAAEALAFLKGTEVDAAFLDIEMPDTDGIELASRILDIQESISAVFVTAYNQYAVEAFRLNAIDYLMKPVTSERLEETLRRIIKAKDKPVYSSKEFHIKCFGKFSVTNGSSEVRFRTVKAEELLAFFIDRKGGFVSRREIIDSLWEDFEGDRAVINFNTTLHYVKKALLQHGVRLSIIYDSGSYRLNTEGLDCDYLKFSAFLENGGEVAQENIREYEEAADYYRGEYLSGWEYEWLS
jgi:two-component SAPR family response regulator